MTASGLFVAAHFAAAAVIGTNPPAGALTPERISALPEDQQSAWNKYLQRSQEQRLADQEFFKNELRQHQIPQLIVPPESRSKRWLGLDRSVEWFGSAEARHTADCIVSFQTPAGGWSKNMDMSGNLRAPGMLFAPDNASVHLSDSDFDAPLNHSWSYVGTFDNDATIIQLRFLAKVISAVPKSDQAAYLSSFNRGLEYIFAAQYPNGGWPQVWPLSGGYHDSITLNDNAMINVMELLRDVSEGQGAFAFASTATRERAATSLQRGIDCLLACQVVVNHQPTIWAQQYDMLTLQPDSARNYEMPSLATGESAGALLFLMHINHPSPKIVLAVEHAAAWFRKNEIRDKAFKPLDGNGRELVSAPGNGPIWARYYEIGSDRPLFGDRDKTIHDSVNEISRERRDGYAWYGDTGSRALAQYEKWEKAHSALESNAEPATK